MHLEIQWDHHNRDGIVLATISKRMHGDSPVLVEILAIKVALEMALYYGLQFVGFFSDSKIAIESIMNPDTSFSWEIYVPLQNILGKKKSLEKALFLVIIRNLIMLLHSLGRSFFIISFF